MKKLLLPVIVLAVVVLALDSCVSSKTVPYFQNIDSISLAPSKGLYDARIMPKDNLTITVNTTDPMAAAPFNLIIRNSLSATNTSVSSGYGSLQTYLVENDGNINFPVVGKIHVQGLTKTECQDLIAEKIKPYLAEAERPIVTVRMSSYRVTITGEVSRPTVVPVTTEKMSVIEALTSAGDLSIYGKRENIILIREKENGEKEYHRLDLTDANIINSPYYYLQQNDIIYVEPNKVKAKNSSIGSSTTIWFSFISIVTSVASLLVNILRN
ncbi:MAG: polysaccharide biosynthesis/export family protein [Prevotella sp.]|nr:polysaccharide biosynthesis/export family protein [Prevotella sp.]